MWRAGSTRVDNVINALVTALASVRSEEIRTPPEKAALSSKGSRALVRQVNVRRRSEQRQLSHGGLALR
jgi:hypothetical protein